MSVLVTISSINYSGENANILFKPDNDNVVINLGDVTLPYTFNSALLTPQREIFGTYTIYTLANRCTNFLNIPRPTPTPTLTRTPTRTPTSTPTPTPTITPTFDPCKVPTPTPSVTTTPTITPTKTSTPAPTCTDPCFCVTKTPTPTPTITPTITPTKSPIPEPSGIYYGKFSGTSITIGDIGPFTFETTNDPTNDFVSFVTGTSYGYILIPVSLPQPTGFRDSNAGCTGFNIPINNIGQIIIIDGNGFPITYNIYRTFFPFFGDVDCWLCN